MAELKRVSLKVAKALKEAGYPQDENEERKMRGLPEQIDCPYAMNVWLWLWREKKVELSFCYEIRVNDDEETLSCLPLRYHERSHPKMKYIIRYMNHDVGQCCSHGYNHKHADPEEAIISAINYLVDNDLIK